LIEGDEVRLLYEGKSEVQLIPGGFFRSYGELNGQRLELSKFPTLGQAWGIPMANILYHVSKIQELWIRREVKERIEKDQKDYTAPGEPFQTEEYIKKKSKRKSKKADTGEGSSEIPMSSEAAAISGIMNSFQTEFDS
jgi:hypothetical protein